VAKKNKSTNVITQAVEQFDEIAKRYLETIPKQIQDAQIDPPGGRRKQQLRPTNPFGRI
jgi:hypothetical protein